MCRLSSVCCPGCADPLLSSTRLAGSDPPRRGADPLAWLILEEKPSCVPGDAPSRGPPSLLPLPGCQQLSAKPQALAVGRGSCSASLLQPPLAWKNHIQSSRKAFNDPHAAHPRPDSALDHLRSRKGRSVLPRGFLQPVGAERSGWKHLLKAMETALVCASLGKVGNGHLFSHQRAETFVSACSLLPELFQDSQARADSAGKLPSPAWRLAHTSSKGRAH